MPYGLGTAGKILFNNFELPTEPLARFRQYTNPFHYTVTLLPSAGSETRAVIGPARRRWAERTRWGPSLA